MPGLYDDRHSLPFCHMRMNIRRIGTVIGLCLFGLMVFGCARFTVPAPETPVTPIAEPVIESSTVNLPVSVSLKSILNDVGQMSRDEEHDGQDRDRESIIAGKIQDFFRRQASKSRNNIAQSIYVRQLAGKAWDALQGPIKLTADISLLLNPQSVHVSPLSGPDDMVKFVVGIVAKPKLIAGTVLPITAQPPLPSLLMTPVPQENGIHIALESLLSFDFLSNELTKRLEGRAYSANGGTVIVEKVRLYGSGGSVVMAVSVKGTVKGTVYLTGMPVYDESARSISLRDPEYTVETKQVLVKVAGWLLHTKLREGLAERATWYVGDRIDAAKALLSDALNRNLSRHVRISGKVLSLRPVAVGMTATSIKAVIVADGTAEMNVF
jgi:hypothetical protein